MRAAKKRGKEAQKAKNIIKERARPYIFDMREHEGYDKYRYDGRVLYGTVSDAVSEHAVEDVRTPKEISEPAEKDRPRKRKRGGERGKGRSRAIVVCLAVFLFSLSVFLADVLSGASTLADYVALFTGKRTDAEIYYAVYATHSTDMGVSYKNAAAIQAEGGAGYVLKRGEEYYVIVSAYETKEDADAVLNKHRNYGVIEIEIYPFSREKCPSLSLAESGSETYKEAYEFLYGVANDMASGVYDASEMKKRLTSKRAEIAAYEEAFRTGVSGKEDNAGIEYKVQLKSMLAAFDNLLSHDKELVAEARYYSVLILHSYSLFTEKYFK